MARNVCQAFLCDAVQAGDEALRQVLRYVFSYEPGIDTGAGLKVADKALKAMINQTVMTDGES